MEGPQATKERLTGVIKFSVINDAGVVGHHVTRERCGQTGYSRT